MTPDTRCPVCGYDLGFEAWDSPSASGEICPSCDSQFGYDDAAGGDVERRRAVHAEWRRSWVEAGKPWSSIGSPAPAGWDPDEQLSMMPG